VLTAMLAKITGTPGAMAFNLQTALVIALSAVTAYGVVYNLLSALLKEKRPASQPGPASLLAPIFVLLVSNLEGFLHMLHRRGLFWTREANGALVSPFWQWLDIKDLNLPPAEPFTWAPTQHWWWWRASRVVQDYDLAGNAREIIDEFPFFSFLLADLHPHVLAMPFALLVMSLALALFLSTPGKPIAAFQRQISLRTAAWSGLIAIPFGLAALFYGISNLRVSMRLDARRPGAGCLTPVVISVPVNLLLAKPICGKTGEIGAFVSIF
jgi:uncharacterized membrane protein